MNAQAWALAGVVVGALVGTVGQIVNAWLQRKWAKDDRAADQEQRTADARSSAFAAAFESIARLTAELAKSSIEEWTEEEDTEHPNTSTTSLVLNSANAVDPDALRHFVSAISTLRLYIESPVLDQDELTTEITDYLTFWHVLRFRKRPDTLISRLNQLSKEIGDLYRVGILNSRPG